jgi:hypothetical protein
MIAPSEIIRRYWRYRWFWPLNGDLHIITPDRTIIIKEADYVPKSQRVTA